MNKDYAAALLGMADNEVTGVTDSPDGTLIDTFDGNTMIVIDGPVALTEDDRARTTREGPDGAKHTVLLYRPPVRGYNDYPVFAGYAGSPVAGPDERLNAAEVAATAQALVDDPGPGGVQYSGGGGPAEVVEPKRLSEPNADTGARNVVDPADPDDSGTVVPDGNADEVLDWVGEDKARAEQALGAEQSRPQPRSTLIGKLQRIVGE